MRLWCVDYLGDALANTCYGGSQIYRLRTVFKYNRSTAVFPLCCLFGFAGTFPLFSSVGPSVCGAIHLLDALVLLLEGPGNREHVQLTLASAIACGIGTVVQFSEVSPGNGLFLASLGAVFTFVCVLLVLLSH